MGDHSCSTASIVSDLSGGRKSLKLTFKHQNKTKFVSHWSETHLSPRWLPWYRGEGVAISNKLLGKAQRLYEAKTFKIANIIHSNKFPCRLFTRRLHCPLWFYFSWRYSSRFPHHDYDYDLMVRWLCPYVPGAWKGLLIMYLPSSFLTLCKCKPQTPA